MRRIILLLSVTLLATFSAAATADQSSDINAYLNAVGDIDRRMSKIYEQMGPGMASLQETIASGDYDPAAINAQIEGYITSMRAVETTVKALQPPEAAKTHYEAMLSQYEVLLAVFARTPQLIDISGKIAKLGKAVEATEDATEIDGLVAQMETLKEKMDAISKETDAMAIEGKKFGVVVKAEKAKLLKITGPS